MVRNLSCPAVSLKTANQQTNSCHAQIIWEKTKVVQSTQITLTKFEVWLSSPPARLFWFWSLFLHLDKQTDRAVLGGCLLHWVVTCNYKTFRLMPSTHHKPGISWTKVTFSLTVNPMLSCRMTSFNVTARLAAAVELYGGYNNIITILIWTKKASYFNKLC